MFEVTFLGHQGWLVEAAGSRILVDPLLCDDLDHTDNAVVKVYPPRQFDLARFPKIDAVVFSHEHPDHFSINSLLRLERGTPCFLSGRASTAARRILDELGFQATLLHPGEMVTVGNLEIHPFHSTEITRDEWDVMPLLIRDRDGHGSLATAIDAPESTAFARFVVERGGSKGIWVSSHNHMDLFPLQPGSPQQPAERVVASLANEFIELFESHARQGLDPDVLVLLESGFAFSDDLAWMNRHVFPGRIERVAFLVSDKLETTKLRTPLPGHRFQLRMGELIDESARRLFLSTAPQEEWPPRDAEPLNVDPPDYGPATGHKAFSTDALAILLEELRLFAQYLYGRNLHHTLYTTGFSSSRPVVGFSLRTDSEPLQVAYRPEACAFELVPPNSLSAGIECWASDLLAILRFDLYAGHITLGRYRKWNSLPGQMTCDLEADLTLYTHPLLHPERTLALYRKMARI